MDIKEKVKLLPEVPGVYLMKDSRDNIMYVGKSKCLKKRVSQYFRNSKNHVPKIVKMVQSIRDFNYITTDTEFEALMLECKLIKEIKPMYNSQMKNDKRYVYIKITLSEEFPRILVSYENDEDGSLYFGPYTSLNRIEGAVDAIRENYQLRSCSSANIPRGSSGCLSSQLGLCSGPCANPEAKSKYMDQVNGAISFLQGKDSSIVEWIEKRMEEASLRLDFSRAANYRDAMYGLNHILNKQRTINFTNRVRNIAVIEPLGNSYAKFFLIRNNKLLFSEKIDYINMNKYDIKKKITDSIIKYLSDIENKLAKIIDKQDIDQAQIIYSYLKNKKNNCSYILIRNSWIKDSSGIKLGNEIDRLLDKLGNP